MQSLKKIRIFKKLTKEVDNWRVPIMCYLGIMNKEKIIYFKNGTRCFIRNKSDAIAFFENYFLKLNTPDKRFEIKSNDTIVDIGAHVGYFTILAAKNANLGTVYSVEPHKESIELLKKNLELNNLKNVETINAAIAKTTGRISLYIDKNDQIGNTIIKKNNQNLSENVNALSLEDFMNNNQIEKIDFLKMDCEGAEFEIFYNLDKELLKKIKKISAEIHEYNETVSLEELKEFFEKNNFIVNTTKILVNSTMKLSMLYAENKIFRGSK